jgi:hypothetical protein
VAAVVLNRILCDVSLQLLRREINGAVCFSLKTAMDNQVGCLEVKSGKYFYFVRCIVVSEPNVERGYARLLHLICAVEMQSKKLIRLPALSYTEKGARLRHYSHFPHDLIRDKLDAAAEKTLPPIEFPWKVPRVDWPHPYPFWRR